MKLVENMNVGQMQALTRGVHILALARGCSDAGALDAVRKDPVLLTTIAESLEIIAGAASPLGDELKSLVVES